MPLGSPRWLVVALGRNFAPSEYLRSRVELCDILNTSQSNLTPKTFYSMPKKSKSKFVMKSVQKSAAKSVNNKPYVKKRKINSSLKCSPTVDILTMSTKETKTENSHHNFDQKNELVGAVLSDYELMCKKNIAEKMAFLESLNIDQAKKDLVAVKTREKLVKPKPRGLKIKLKAQSPPLRPKSLRLQRISPEGSPLPEIKALSIPTNDHPRKPHGSMLFSDIFAQEDKNLSQNFLKISSSLEKEVLKLEPLSYNRFEKCFRSMKIKPSLVAKVTPTRIFSLAIHPSLSKILICAGSKWGHIGFWDVESSDGQDGVYLFEPHSRPVNCLAYNPENPCELYSSSYDGTVRCGNLQATIFDEIYCADENEELRCTYFDFLSSNSLLVSQSNGSVAVVDTRTKGLKADHYHKTHLCPIKTVNVHPVKKEYFIAAGNNGVVSLWDMRCLKKSSLADLVHGRSVNSAYFSPVTGNTILSTALDNKLRLFDSSVLNEEVKAVVSIRHDNFTGRWLTGFRATWLPGNEDAFIVGSMLYPRRIEVYQITGMLSHNFEGEDLGSICSINAFHPTRAVLAGANSSGKVHVFMGSEK